MQLNLLMAKLKQTEQLFLLVIIRKTVFGYVTDIQKDFLYKYKFGEREQQYKETLMMKKKNARDAKHWVRYHIRVKKMSEKDKECFS